MSDRDLTPEERHNTLNRIDNRDRRIKNLQVAVLVVVVLLNLVTTIQLVTLIQTNEEATLEYRKANQQRQHDLQDYIKCLSVARFDVPKAELQTREGVLKALDDCAKQ